jgi:hypothetical protein
MTIDADLHPPSNCSRLEKVPPIKDVLDLGVGLVSRVPVAVAAASRSPALVVGWAAVGDVLPGEATEDADADPSLVAFHVSVAGNPVILSSPRPGRGAGDRGMVVNP